MLIYKDDQLLVRRRDDMLFLETTIVASTDMTRSEAWLPADEALFLAESIIAAFRAVEKAA